MCRDNTYSGEIENEKMNSWKEELSSPADTYVEWRFEHKCRQISNGFKYITEWRTLKQECIARMETTVFDFQHYSRHDVSHSIAILEAIELLLGKKNIDALNVNDLWLLLVVAYSHDVGMALTYEELLKLWKYDSDFQNYIWECIQKDFGDLSKAALYYKEADNLLRDRKKMEKLQGYEEISFEEEWPVLSYKYIMILVAEYIRKTHAVRVSYLFEKVGTSRQSAIPQRLYKVAQVVCQMHGKSFPHILKDLKRVTKGFNTGMTHPQFAAVMLRMGDLLDLENNRFNPYAIEHFGRLPMASQLHLAKHKAISHILISQSEICVEAHVDGADSMEVAIITNDWFQSIRQETINLINYWNDIVPEALRGCRLKVSDCKVYVCKMKGGKYRLFDATQQQEFSVNKEHLISLLIGVNIYESRWEFLREYLQNALDASKMQLWRDLKTRRYGVQINDHIWNMDDLMPFDLDYSVYQNYGIQIDVGWNRTGRKVLVRIIDKGIGIEREFLDNLSNVGSGWEKRTKYAEDMKEMLCWLRPTGGFGIGLQSAFMRTDKVVIKTKSDYDTTGLIITMNSPKTGGVISVEEDTNASFLHGTSVLVEIDVKDFQTWESKRKFDTDKDDEFNPDSNLFHFRDIIIDYVKEMFPNTLFPIEVSCTTGKSKFYINEPLRSVCGYWKEGAAYLYREVQHSNKKYWCCWYAFNYDNIFQNKFLVWESKDAILYQFAYSGAFRRGQKILCFKNALVKKAETDSMQIYSALEMNVDFMGFRAADCLGIHRNDFIEQFDKKKYCKDAISAFLQFLYIISLMKFDDKKNVGNNEALNEQINIAKKINAEYPIRLLCVMTQTTELDNGALCEGSLSGFCYKAEESSEQELRISKEQKKIMDQTVIQKLEELYQFQVNVATDLKEYDEYVGLFMYVGEEIETKLKVDIAFHHNTIISWLKDRKIEGDANGKMAYLLNCMFNSDGNIISDPYTADKLMRDEFLEKELYKLPEKEYIVHLTKPKPISYYPKKEILEHFWLADKAEYGRRKICCGGVSDYEKLLVSSVPFGGEAEKGSYFLLSPVSKSARTDVLQHISSKKKIDYFIFRELVWGAPGHESQEYHMLIEWVTAHQKKEGEFTEGQIKETYEQMLQDLYQECVSNP